MKLTADVLNSFRWQFPLSRFNERGALLIAQADAGKILGVSDRDIIRRRTRDHAPLSSKVIDGHRYIPLEEVLIERQRREKRKQEKSRKPVF